MAMMMKLNGSVGIGGNNIRPDVVAVQTLLAQRGQRPGAADGVCGPKTIGAIRAFQATFLRMPDGLISVNGPTWQRLTGSGGGAGVGGALGPAGSGLGSLGPVGSGLGKLPGAQVPLPPKDGNMTTPVARPPANTFNIGLKAVSNQMMKSMFGMPRDSFTQDCQPMNNAALKRNVVTDNVGSFKATGLRPAVASLKQVYGEIAGALPQLAPRIGTAGMLCCRLQRRSKTAVSNHSWGTAIDLTINGVLDKYGDGKVQYGLTLIAPIFNRHGWYWGAAFGTEDGMHFEASVELANKIKAQLS